MNNFAKLLDEYMKTVGLTDEALADKIQVSKMTVYNWRTGKIEQPASRKKLLKCADILELTLKQRLEFIIAAGHLPEKYDPPQPPSMPLS
ncbi:Helix-turn-helix type 3 domain protein [Candidatus Thiomargarita nelsonii]|uniref:Helix-turn-helix type 3 domain protein n=1 Tax=Candidatus Thiomargarita nelsonii TaxID=1003181 RepID=A0A0A6RL57_9GAMM|nr:Helix-turn-helix type 3 domain protein [Candidatus Thiomargarita nelsonii]